MKHALLAFALSLFPFAACASILLADCDDKPYDVIVKNAGATRVVRLTKNGGEIEEFGAYPMISFQIKAAKGDDKTYPVMRPTGPDEEFCIWSGNISVQRLDVIGGWHGGSWR